MKGLYKSVWSPGHPRGSNGGQIYEHVAVAERALGHYLPARAQIHHVDGDRHNNAPSNLVICENQQYHALLHVRTRTLKAGGNPNTEKVCGKCSRAKPLTAFGVLRRNKNGLLSHCKDCNRAAGKVFLETHRATINAYQIAYRAKRIAEGNPIPRKPWRVCVENRHLEVAIENAERALVEERYCEIAARRLQQKVLPFEMPA